MKVPSPASFEKLLCRHRLRAELVTVTGLRIGAGKNHDAAATDQPILRDAFGRPYLPGSSLKGCLRSTLEAILRSLDRRANRNLWACEIFERGQTGPDGFRHGGGRCVGDSLDDQKLASKGKEIPLQQILERTCTACSLFGSSHLAGRVFIHDLPWLGDDPRIDLRDGVGIDRDLGTAAPKVKYDFEAVPPGSRFQLEIICENLDPEGGNVRLALLLATLDLLHRGEILLGGLSRRGLGRVQLANPTLEWTNAERLLSFQGYDNRPTYQEQVASAQKTLHDLLTAKDSLTGEPTCTNNG